jgi:hypothetical protein
MSSLLAGTARLVGTFALSACILAFADGRAFAQADGKAGGKIPQLSSNPSSWAWVRIRADGRNALYGDGWLDPPAGLRGPIKNHPDHPLQGNNDRQGRQVTLAIGNHLDPILKPWAAEQMRQSNEELLSGKVGIPFRAQSQCWPGGVPANLLWSSEPMYFIQTPKQVWIYWQRDQWVRRIVLADHHSEHVKPGWFGDSIGHYENGELVIDTIGIAANKYSFLDDFRTPHTDKLHVVEHFKITPDGKFLEVLVKVEDADTFKEPMYMAKRWRRDRYVWAESICAENNIDPFNANLVPPPEATHSDF